MPAISNDELLQLFGDNSQSSAQGSISNDELLTLFGRMPDENTTTKQVFDMPGFGPPVEMTPAPAPTPTPSASWLGALTAGGEALIPGVTNSLIRGTAGLGQSAIGMAQAAKDAELQGAFDGSAHGNLVGYGLANPTTTLATLAGVAGAEAIPQGWLDAGRRELGTIQESLPKSDVAKQSFRAGGYKSPQWYAENAAEALPLLSAQIAASILGGPVAAASLTGAMVGGGQYEESKQRALSQGWEEKDAQNVAMTEAIVIGGVNALLEKVLGPWGKGVPGWTEKIVGKELVKNTLAQMVANGVREGSTEVAQELTSQIAKQIIEDDPSLGPLAKGNLDKAIDQGVVGALLGMGMGHLNRAPDVTPVTDTVTPVTDTVTPVAPEPETPLKTWRKPQPIDLTMPEGLISQSPPTTLSPPEGQASKAPPLHSFSPFAPKPPEPPFTVPDWIIPQSPPTTLSPPSDAVFDIAPTKKVFGQKKGKAAPKPLPPSQQGPLRTETVEIQAPPETTPTQDVVESVSPTGQPHDIQRVSTANLKVDRDRFQFKGDVDEEGVVRGESLGGAFDPVAAGVVLVWEDKNGQQYIVNGHHRLSKARREGVDTMLARVIRERDGVTEQQARALGAELNIKEGQGSEADYARFFRETGISEEDATQRGLLARNKGRTGYVLGRLAEDDLYAAFRMGKISADRAAAIASEAPSDAGLQVAILNRAKGKGADELRSLTRLMRMSRGQAKESQGDLFGFDDSAIQEMEAMAKGAAKIIRQKRDLLLAVIGATRRPDAAKKMGLSGVEEAQQRLPEVQQDLARWDHWETDRDLVRNVREAIGLSSPETQQQTAIAGFEEEAADIARREQPQQSLFRTPEQRQGAFLDLGKKDLPGQQTMFDTDPLPGLMEELGDKPRAGLQSPAQPVVRQTLSTVARKEGDTAPGISEQDILKTWENDFGVPLRRGGFSGQAQAIYKYATEVARMKPWAANLASAIHEIAHHIDKQTKITSSVPAQIKQALGRLDYDPQQQRAFEGFAEFIRHYITEGDTARNAPEVYDWFTKEFLPKHPQWQQPLERAKQHAGQFADQSVFQQIGTMFADRGARDVRAKEAIQQGVERGWTKFRRKWDDIYAATIPLDKRFKELGGKAAATLWQTSWRLHYGAKTAAAMALEAGVHDVYDDTPIGTTSLKSVAELVDSDAEYQEADRYALARHTLFMAKRKPGYFTGITPEQAQVWVDEVRKNPAKFQKYEQYAKGLAQYNNDLLAMMQRAGLMSEESYRKQLDYYGDHYYDLRRVTDKGGFSGGHGGQAFANLPSPTKRRSQRGDSRPISPGVESAMAKTSQWYQLAANAHKQQALLRQVDPEFGAPDGMGVFADKVDPKMVAQKVRASDVIKELQKAGILSENNEDIEALAPEELLREITLWRSDLTPSADKATVTMPDKSGNLQLYEVDRVIYDTVTDAEPHQLGPLTKMVAASSRLFKRAATGLNLTFGISNPIRDFIEYQGKAQAVRGSESITRPVRLGTTYALRKLKADDLLQFIGEMTALQSLKDAGVWLSEDNRALTDMFDRFGGRLFTAQPYTQADRSRLRRSWTNKNKFGFDPKHPFQFAWDKTNNAIEALESLIAVGDAPPRLAEMEGLLRERGWVAEGRKWKNLNTGQLADHIPADDITVALSAAGNATTHFGITGTMGQEMEAWLPFSGAIKQSLKRQYEQISDAGIGAAKALGAGKFSKTVANADPKTIAQAKRYAAYALGMAAVGGAAWWARHEDDDYREQDEYLRRLYWSWGTNGKTYVRVPKPRNDAIISNVVEQLLDAWVHPDDAHAKQAAWNELLDRAPGGGGAARTGAEMLMNYNIFRDQPITPDYQKDLPPEDQYNPYTLETSKALSYHAGKYFDMSPQEIEHAINGVTGGQYYRQGRLLEKAYSEGPQSLGLEDSPLRGVFLDRHQARSVTDFYDHLRQLGIDKHRQERDGQLTSQTYSEKSLADDYNALMSNIRKAEPRKFGDRRSHDYEKYIVGLAREALGRHALPSNPSPWDDSNAPAAIQPVLINFATSKLRRGELGDGKPQWQNDGSETRQQFEDRLQKWTMGQQADLQWLQLHGQSPWVQQAREDIKATSGFRKVASGEGQPQSGRDFAARSKRWKEKVRAAREFGQK